VLLLLLLQVSVHGWCPVLNLVDPVKACSRGVDAARVTVVHVVLLVLTSAPAPQLVVPGPEGQQQRRIHSLIHVTPVAEAHLSNASPFQTPLVTPNNKLTIPTTKDNKGACVLTGMVHLWVQQAQYRNKAMWGGVNSTRLSGQPV
jgi:hypothetical protein